MHKPIRRAGVIGAGVMGQGIAAHFANAGVEVILLDIVPPNLTEAQKSDKKARDAWAAGGLEKAQKSRPAAFFHARNAKLVSVGNTEDDLGKLETCDLVIEAIIEKMEAKQALFEKLEKICKPGTIVASNTSGLQIVDMLKGRSEAFKKSFLVMHFFNPVRYMKLLELVCGPDTDPAVYARVKWFGEDQLGKGIVVGKDTPNFVGNRIGVHAMLSTIHLMLEEGLAPEDVDAITGSPMAHPKSASFRTADLVGLDTFAHVAQNCWDSLPNDEERAVFQVPAYIKGMIEKKYLGDKTKGGFYKKVKGGEDAGVFTLDPKTLEYRPKGGDEGIKAATKKISKIEDPRARVKALVADTGKAGAFAWKVLSRGLAYSARRIGEIADDVTAVDEAMKWGYNWELGPFEVWDALGFAETYDRMVKDGVKLPASVEKMRASGATGFYKDDGSVYDLGKGAYSKRDVDPRITTLPALRKGGAPVLKNDGAEAWDLGDGVLGLTFKTKANSIDPDVISLIGQAV
ncbi:MAG: 3-hydroxyacyl-CoA dehydrogenase family protein, partial [Myxococcales bacterium]|nr:3-hydroxyacyl-CoA dehydrogenase family protein [Myxococcales bacterium]